jgi:hypothetical protein
MFLSVAGSLVDRAFGLLRCPRSQSRHGQDAPAAIPRQYV